MKLDWDYNSRTEEALILHLCKELLITLIFRVGGDRDQYRKIKEDKSGNIVRKKVPTLPLNKNPNKKFERKNSSKKSQKSDNVVGSMNIVSKRIK